jgi:3-hydroxyacyl-CoA dehydrogenase / enoyl-CoA hydratase / 3-hydroxybutyryl-CoA epimerase
MQKIETVCVIGAGVMGSGIAAQVANSKTNVILLDIADNESGNKNKIVNDAYDRLFTQKPAPLSHPNYAKYIKIGNLEDDISLIREADLIIEVIVEKLEIKHQLYESVSKYLKPTAILASNTSTLPLAQLKEKLPDNVRKNFVITHFFNPPRYMELVELITDYQTSREMVSELSNFLKKSLGKTIVYCNDTPGFIANRIGCFLLELTVRKGIKENLNPAQIDYIFLKFLGFPSTGIFGLYDLIGHDVMNLISASLLESLPSSDKYHQACFPITFLEEMKTRNFLGRKSSSGFYRLIKNLEGKRAKQVINFDNLDYDPLPSIVEYKDIQEVLNCGDKYSKFVSDILADFFSYVISLIPTVTESKTDIDKAMKLGYSLKYGPFELLSKMPNKGERWLKLKELNQKIPDNIKNHSYGKEQQGYKIIFNNDSAHLELIDNHHVFVIKSKMNSLDSKVFNLMIEAIDYCENKNEALYIFPLGDNFSAGANLKYFKEAIEGKNFKLIGGLLQLGQKAMLRLKYSKIPVISCARGSALGGGCGILLHSNFVVAHQNLNSGLVELGVGLIPGWGGTKEMFLRSQGNKTKLLANLKNILFQNKSSSADYFALDYSVEAVINMNKNLILEQAFQEKFQNAYSNSSQVDLPQISLINEMDHSGFDKLQIDIMNFFQKIIDKKSVTEGELLDLEKEKFLQLAATPISLERISKFV